MRFDSYEEDMAVTRRIRTIQRVAGKPVTLRKRLMDQIPHRVHINSGNLSNAYGKFLLDLSSLDGDDVLG